MSKIQRPCPICAGNERKVLYHQKFYEGTLGDGYNVVVCSTCGMGFADGILSQHALNRYYANEEKYSYESNSGVESEFDIARFQQTFQDLRSFVSPEARILDIGCATGGLLSVFKRHGYKNVMGLDPSRACAVAADRLYNIEVRTATLEEVDGWEERFDLILMVGVLEHLQELVPAVKNVIRLLRPQGQLYVAVPDVEGLAECRNAPFQQFSMEHVNFFSQTSLNRTMASCGFSPRVSWQWKTEWRRHIMEPIVSGLFQRSSVQSLEVDHTTIFALQQYIKVSELGDRKIARILEGLLSTQAPIFVWGVGTLTRRLLATTRLKEANIVGFIDSDSRMQQRRLLGKIISNPLELKGSNEAILICSISFEQEILKVIRDDLRLSNKVISLEC